MGSPTLVSISFGGNNVHLRKHWGGVGPAFGLELITFLEEAGKEKARLHFHTGSYFVRMLLSSGYGAGGLPDFEMVPMPLPDTADTDFRGDWDSAYLFECFGTGEAAIGLDAYEWRIGYLQRCSGERIEALRGLARWYTLEEFRSFAESKTAAEPEPT